MGDLRRAATSAGMCISSPITLTVKRSHTAAKCVIRFSASRDSLYLLPGHWRNRNSQVWGVQMANTKWPPVGRRVCVLAIAGRLQNDACRDWPLSSWHAHLEKGMVRELA